MLFQISAILVFAFSLQEAVFDVAGKTTLNREKFNEVGTLRDYSCYDSFGKPYIKDLPHPYNCNLFLKCEDRQITGPIPIVFECGANLHFSLLSCRCERPSDALCFDSDNLDHAPLRMQCACPLILGPGGIYIPDYGDKRCQNGR